MYDGRKIYLVLNSKAFRFTDSLSLFPRLYIYMYRFYFCLDNTSLDIVNNQ